MYCEIADIVAAKDKETIAQWSDDAAGVEVNKAVVNDAIKKACADIDSIVSVRYTTPIASVSDVLRGKAVDIAVWYLATRRPGLEATEDVVRIWKAALAWCDKVAAGKANIVGATDPPPAKQSYGDYSADERKFTSDTMEGF